MLPQCPACTNRRKRRVEAYSHCTGRPSTELSMLRVCTRTLLASQAACCTAYSNRTMLAGLSSLSTIEVSQEGPTAVVALNRPKQMNALSTEVRVQKTPCSRLEYTAEAWTARCLLSFLTYGSLASASSFQTSNAPPRPQPACVYTLFRGLKRV